MHERPSHLCICSSRRHVRMHGSHARKEHVVTIAGSSVPAVSDAQDDNILDSRRTGAGQVARDASLQPDARVERSERWRLCAANDGIRAVWERCAPTHLRLPQDPRRSSIPPCCAGRGYSWRSCVMVGTSRDQRGGWTGAGDVPHRVCGVCCGNGCCAAPVPHQCSQRGPTRCVRHGAHPDSGRRTWLDVLELWWPQAPSAPCTCTVRYGRTRQLNVHVAGRNGHVAGPGWAFQTVSSLVAASSGCRARVLDSSHGSDDVARLGEVRRVTASETLVHICVPKRFRG